MILFRLPTIQHQSHRLMIWGIEKTWSQSGRWDYATIAWHFEKALHETTFDRESTKLHPPGTRSAIASEILASLKKSTYSLQKLHSRHLELFCVAKLKGESDQYFIEGRLPAWVKLLKVGGSLPAEAMLSQTPHGEWFSLEHDAGSSLFLVRADIDECVHQYEISEPETCRFESLSEWLSALRPNALAFNPEDI